MVRVLVAHGSRYGSTKGVAEFIGQALQGHGIEASVLPASAVNDPSTYDAVILGGGVYAGSWHPQASSFLTRHRDALAQMPVACFIVGMAFQGQGEDAERQRTTLTSQIQAHVEPVSVACFAGSTTGMPAPLRFFTRLMGVAHGDYRAWAAIGAWADALVHELGG